MNAREFDKAIAATRMDPAGAATQAARLVLVKGKSRGAAARELGVDVSAVSRAVARLRPGICPTCGQAVPGKAG